MFDRLRQSKLLFWSIELLILAVLIFVCTKISFLFDPIGTFISTLFGPIIGAGLLFYLFNPLINLLGKLKISRNWAIAIIFIVFFGGLIFIVATVIPNLIKQITQLVTNLPDFAHRLQKVADDLSNNPRFKNIDFNKYVNQLDLKPSKIAEKVMKSFTSGFGSMIGAITSVTVSVFTIPIMLFYMLKDGHRLVPNIQKMLPDRYNDQVADLLRKMGATISAYIGGQALECLFVGVFTFIGYLIIGMPYAYLLGFIAGVSNVIPYLGPYIGIAPALIISLSISIPKTIMVIVVVIVVQQIDGNLIYPNVIGRSLDIHPLTIIIILLVAGNIYGILGMILAIPFYAVSKTVITYLYDIQALRTKAKKGTDL
ncbi:AI-2E family transporter [Lactobacillus curvatus]|uniref:AI-2E family transporter n=1 Tax=Latilactobacillus fragifolii TaxID=2814244 RepID=UPI0012B07C67|nr:AI-2E family transporter [Latilactobacillus fragifolii]MSD83454.1 AI-2E family transporter [Latilactobacillus curvatus]MSE23645.1 AI-2E family transporter [Latilactobacillus curvatus]